MIQNSGTCGLLREGSQDKTKRERKAENEKDTIELGSHWRWCSQVSPKPPTYSKANILYHSVHQAPAAARPLGEDMIAGILFQLRATTVVSRQQPAFTAGERKVPGPGKRNRGREASPVY